jgi:hypothetical protein
MARMALSPSSDPWGNGKADRRANIDLSAFQFLFLARTCETRSTYVVAKARSVLTVASGVTGWATLAVAAQPLARTYPNSVARAGNVTNPVACAFLNSQVCHVVRIVTPLEVCPDRMVVTGGRRGCGAHAVLYHLGDTLQMSRQAWVFNPILPGVLNQPYRAHMAHSSKPPRTRRRSRRSRCRIEGSEGRTGCRTVPWRLVPPVMTHSVQRALAQKGSRTRRRNTTRQPSTSSPSGNALARPDAI